MDTFSATQQMSAMLFLKECTFGTSRAQISVMSVVTVYVERHCHGQLPASLRHINSRAMGPRGVAARERRGTAVVGITPCCRRVLPCHGIRMAHTLPCHSKPPKSTPVYLWGQEGASADNTLDKGAKFSWLGLGGRFRWPCALGQLTLLLETGMCQPSEAVAFKQLGCQVLYAKAA